MFDVLAEWMGPAEMKSISSTGYNNFTRLPIISHMDGHSKMCFDYGWDAKNVREHPHVCFFNDDFEEYLRINSFDEFVGGLRYSGYECETYYYAIKVGRTLEEEVANLNSHLALNLEIRMDYKYSQKYFDKEFIGKIEIENEQWLRIELSQNEYLSANRLFQEKPGKLLIMRIVPYVGKFASTHLNSDYYSDIVSKIFSELYTSNELEPLLIPFHLLNDD